MKKFGFYILITFTLLINNIFAQWEECNNGLYGGSVSCITMSENHLFAGTSGGGIFLSTDNGNSWNTRNNGLTNYFIWAIRKRLPYCS